MNVYKINYTYKVQGKRPVAGDESLFAASQDEAVEGFMAIHPDGSTFTYKIVSVETLAAGELF